jgi:membrane protease YdiL (CAAX protease family)
MYIALIAGAVVVAAALVHGSDSRAWAVAGGLALSVIVGYVISRTIGLPNSADDIGNWLEPLGLASLFVEAGVVGVSGLVLLDRARVTAGRPVLEAYAHA